MDSQWIEEGGYYRVTFRGLRTLPAILALMEEVRALAESSGVERFLFDLEDSEEGFSVADKFQLGTYLGTHFGRFVMAVYMREEHITGFVENVSANRGATRFRITHDEAEAMAFMRHSGRESA
jgi:hypothetical protein